MLLEGKVAVVYGGGGAIGGAIARAFAQEGARVHLGGRTAAKLEAVAQQIADAGGEAHTTVLDALDAEAVAQHADAVVQADGAIDVAVNAVGIAHVQGTPFAELALADFELPIARYTRTHFVTAKAVAPHMTARGGGVIMTVSTPGSKLPGPGFLGFGVTCAAIEAFTRLLAGELGEHGVRVVCLRPDAIPQAAANGSHSREVFEPVAERHGLTVEAMLATAAQGTLLNRLPTLDQVARTAAFVASDGGGALTGTVVNLTCGSLVD